MDRNNSHKSLKKNGARAPIKEAVGREKIRLPLLIPFEHKTGGILCLSFFAGVLVLGSLAGGSGATAKSIIYAKNAKKLTVLYYICKNHPKVVTAYS